MAFLAPMFLLGALAAVVPIVLHLLRREPEARVKFSAVRLLRNAPIERASRRRLRELLLLALRVAALALLALAFARPFFDRGNSVSAGITVVAVDTSLSMSAPGQFEKARQLARQAIIQAPAGDLVAVIAFDDTARVVRDASTDRALAAASAESLEAGVSSTRYRAGIDAAASLIGGRRAKLVVVTDLQQAGWEPGDGASIPSTTDLEIADVGPSPQNLAVTALRLDHGRILATVRNTGTQQRQARLHLTAVAESGGQPARVGETLVSVGPSQTSDVAFAAPRGRWASVSVDDSGGLRGDNERFVVLETSGRPNVLVVTTSGDLGRDAFYVEQALVAAGADGSRYDVEGAAGSALQSWTSARLDAHPVLVLLSTRGLDHRGRELLVSYVRAGGGMLVAAGPEIDPEIVDEVLGGIRIGLQSGVNGPATLRDTRRLAPADIRHPVLQSFAGTSLLQLVTFQRVTSIRGTACQTLARFTSGEAALLECEAGKGRAIVFASDLDRKGNDFPLHPSFVPFVHETMRYLASARPLSDYLVAAVPPGVPAVPGVASHAAAPGASPMLVAVNVDPAESEPARLSSNEFQAAVTRLKDVPVSEQYIETRDKEERQHIWQYALALMMATLAAESVVAAKAV